MHGSPLAFTFWKSSCFYGNAGAVARPWDADREGSRRRSAAGAGAVRGCWLTPNVLGAAGEGPGEAVWGHFVCVLLAKLQQGVRGFLSSFSGGLEAEQGAFQGRKMSRGIKV